MIEASFPGVRLARAEDEEPVYRLLLELYAENALLPMNEAKVRAVIRTGTRGQGGIVGVIDGPQGIEASIGMAFSQFWYTEATHLNELWCFVHPDHRQTTHAKRLIEFAKWCADRLSVSGTRVPLLLGIVTRHRLLPKLRLFQRQAPQVGALFMHGIEMADTFGQRREAEIAPPRTVRGSVPDVPHVTAILRQELGS
jgi:GNAT superfamily N-acetyltransferase